MGTRRKRSEKFSDVVYQLFFLCVYMYINVFPRHHHKCQRSVDWWCVFVRRRFSAETAETNDRRAHAVYRHFFPTEKLLTDIAVKYNFPSTREYTFNFGSLEYSFGAFSKDGLERQQNGFSRVRFLRVKRDKDGRKIRTSMSFLNRTSGD